MHGSKTCFKCKKTLPRSQFYKHPQMGDGLLGKCKECTKNDSLLNRKNHIEYYREYDKTRTKQEHRKKLAAEITKRCKCKYGKVHNAVAYAIKTGILIKKPCEMCGTTNFIHAHHDNYLEPLNVMWLCPEHHKARHLFLNEEINEQPIRTNR